MLKIESIQNGIVIDHIPAGKGMDIYKLLELDSQKQSVALLQSVRSEKYGCKDLIKIEGLTEPERLEVLGYLNEGVTLIVIRDGKVVKKYHPVPPETNCQGLFNQIHKNLQKGARSTVWLLTPRLIDYIFPFSRSLQRYA